MNSLTVSSSDALVTLQEWSRAARDLYTRSQQSHDSPGIRALKLYLAERHANHVRDLRELLHELDRDTSLATSSWHAQAGVRFDAEIQRSLQSRVRATTLAACGAVEREITLAYDLVAREPSQLEPRARKLVDVHVTELESLRSFVRQIEMGQPSAPAQPPTAARALAIQ